jgi:hypothetical protein
VLKLVDCKILTIEGEKMIFWWISNIVVDSHFAHSVIFLGMYDKNNFQ